MSTSAGSGRRPAWMDDELVKDIPQKKLDFLEKLFVSSQGKNQREMMMYLMPMMKQAKKEQLTFTSQEMNAAIAAVKKYSTAEELSKIDKILEQSKKQGARPS